MAPGTSTDSQAAVAALKREIRALEKGNAELRKEVDAAKFEVSNEVLFRIMADKHCEQEQATLSNLRKGLALAKKQMSRHTSEIQTYEESLMVSRSMMTEAKESIVANASQEGGEPSSKSQQVASGSATSRKKQVRGRSPPSPKKPYGHGGYASTSSGEVHAGPSAPDSSALENLKDKAEKLVDSPRNAPAGNQAEAEMLGHIRSTSHGLAQAVGEMAELSKNLSAVVSAAKVEKSDGAAPIKDKHYCAVLATRPVHTDVKKYMF
eukprot:gnl/MRDRNA2_/MRDRNA2_97909_c0_seq1.p1 gnl/MRDRNA2_/MRDRNA2_97909_c0~~gnl/MRDRNA2_/MRDRNA2_97909_c0_seq1.p1  ORF type:complete len:265 (-),score=76.71 gnl/MRDRNA2_/MRDRNA2_97909_c0_seq1:61-855(-)